MRICDRKIGANFTPYIVAEISGNHGGILDYAIQLITMAKEAGADAVKTQCYEPDTITIDVRKPDFIIQDGLWRGKTLYELYNNAYTPFEWHKDLYAAAASIDMPIFSSVFDFTSVDFLEKLNCPAYKIASFEITDLPLIRHAAMTRKPVIISTGLASQGEIVEAYNVANEHTNVALLHCTSEYPATADNANLMRMVDIKAMLPEAEVGISDHTASTQVVPVGATILGATIIEKHIKLTNGPKCEDDEFSLTPAEFAMMSHCTKLAWRSKRPAKTARVNPSTQFRRSLYVVKDIKKGEIITPEHVRSIRPGYGLAPKYLDDVLGQKAKQDMRRGDRIVA